jgi:RNA polymerase sigma-70 factor (ECF subfamily)
VESDKAIRFRKIAVPHLRFLYRMAWGMTRNRQDAEDLVQDTYLKAYRFFDRFKEGTNIRGWLFTILRNTYINKYRIQKKEPDKVDVSRIEEFGLYDRLVDRNVEPLEVKSLEKLIGDDVLNALNNLPFIFREVVLLSDVEGLSYKEIASTLHCSMGTVRSRLFRARRMLQKCLWGYVKKRGIFGRK